MPHDAPDPDAWRGRRDPLLWGLLALVLVLQLVTWSRLSGAQLADSVEYMERAQALVRGEEVVDSTAIRGFGYVALLAPAFWVADLLGVADFKPVVAVVRLEQLALGLLLVAATARLGARLLGRRAGLVAGLVVGLNPYVLLYSVEPTSGLAAGLCVALALDALLRCEGPRRALVGGLWLGGALLMAYKTIVVALVTLGLLVLVGRWRERRAWAAAWIGYGFGILGAIGLDKLCYGEWGKSLDLYARMNFGPLLMRFAWRLGWMDLAKTLWDYAGGEQNEYYQAPAATPGEMLHEPNPLYHLLHLPDMVTWPLAVLIAVGALIALARGPRAVRLVAAVFLVAAAAISLKTSTDFRLLLPLSACLGVVAAVGWRALVGAADASARPLRVGAAALLLVVGGAWAQARLGQLTTSRYSGFWRAMEVVDALAARRGADAPDLRVACSWHWAVYLREGARVELVKLPRQLDRWKGYDDAARAADLAALGELDAFVAHLAVLLEHPDLWRAVNERFAVETVLYDRAVYEDLGPLVVFTARTGAPGERAFLTRTRGEAPLDYLAARGLAPGRRFQDARAAQRPWTLLGWTLEDLPTGGHAWLSLHWLCDGPAPGARLAVRPRLLSDAQPLPWEDLHELGRGWAPPAEWRPGEVVSEGWPVVAAAAPFDTSQPWRPLTGDAPPGARVPATLWLRLAPLRDDGTLGAPLAPITNDGGVLVTPERLDAERRGPDGLRVTPEGFVELGAVELRAPQR
ncbi:MAG: hypothetical protein H6828_06615 [Planctomycetes bacterium]|nr:hypothetical protein [Planctomycetota bacterium]